MKLKSFGEIRDSTYILFTFVFVTGALSKTKSGANEDFVFDIFRLNFFSAIFSGFGKDNTTILFSLFFEKLFRWFRKKSWKKKTEHGSLWIYFLRNTRIFGKIESRGDCNIVLLESTKKVEEIKFFYKKWSRLQKNQWKKVK